MDAAQAAANTIQPLDLAEVPGATFARVSQKREGDGVSVTTTYFNDLGNIVRQDQAFIVNPDRLALFSHAGKVGD